MGDLTEKSKKTFEEWSRHYDQDRWSWYFEYCYKAIFQLIRPSIHAGSRILDIGCGTGHLLNRLSSLNRSGENIGIDLVSEMAEIAKARNKSNMNVVIENSSFEEFQTQNKFDIIICSNAFHHIVKPKEAFLKIHSLLENDGYFVYLDPFRDNIFRLAWEYLSKYLFFNEPYIRYFHKKELFDLIDKTGLVVEKYKTILYVILICVVRKKNNNVVSTGLK